MEDKRTTYYQYNEDGIIIGKIRSNPEKIGPPIVARQFERKEHDIELRMFYDEETKEIHHTVKNPDRSISFKNGKPEKDSSKPVIKLLN